nr:hypothetical protein [Tanacetum cinerariifolium]
SSEVLPSVFDSRSSDGDYNPTNDRFKQDDGYHADPPPLTRNYMPPLADLSFTRLDDSVYMPTTNKAIAIISKDEPSVIKTSNISVEMPKVDSVNTANTAAIRPNVNAKSPYFKPHSPKRRHFNQKSAVKTNTFSRIINTSEGKNVTTAGLKAVVNADEGKKETVVKTSTGYVWGPKINDLNNVSKDSSGSWISKRIKLIDPQGSLKSVVAWIPKRN